MKRPLKNSGNEKSKKNERQVSLLSHKIALIFLQLEIEREAKRARKVENAKKTVDGQHGGKHYFEDNEYIESKKETTETTVKSVKSAAKIVAERNKIAEAERLEAERIAEEKRQANGMYKTSNFSMEP